MESDEWLIACLDPYHDFQYDVHGLPDEHCAPSVVQVHNQSYALEKPTAAGTGNWDASILFTGSNTCITAEADGVPCGMMTVTGSSICTYNHAGMSTGMPFGALNLWAGSAGSTMSTGAPVNSNDTYKQLGSVLNTDRCRLIGVAIEVVNTTAEIYKQGSVTTAMLPDPIGDSSLTGYFDNNASPYDATFCQADRGPIQACTLPPLLAVPGSCTWAASEGVYAIPRMAIVPRNTFSYAYGIDVAAFDDRGASTRVPILYGTDGKTAVPTPKGWHTDGAHQILNSPTAPNGFTPLQMWFSGLSNQTVLTVRFRTIVEYFPSLTSSLLALASPSPVFDPRILALYSAVAARAPYAVMVGENAGGDYFRKILKVLGEGLNLISPMFGAYAPLAKIAFAGLSKGASLIPVNQAGFVFGQNRK